MVSAVLPDYAELHCVSNFSFLRGASHPEELAARAAALGYAALAITDECSLAGVVRAHVAAKQHRIKLLVGAEFDGGQFPHRDPQHGQIGLRVATDQLSLAASAIGQQDLDLVPLTDLIYRNFAELLRLVIEDARARRRRLPARHPRKSRAVQPIRFLQAWSGFTKCR